MPRRPRITAKTVRGPRQYLRYPDQFGVTDPAQPAAVPATSRALVAAALFQHELARQAIEQMTRLELDYGTVAAAVGVSEEQLRRLLRGESAMSLERMQQIAAAVGLRLDLRVERTE